MAVVRKSSIDKKEFLEKVIIFIATIILLYLFIALYFTSHLFFNTVINGVDVSLKKYKEADQMLRDYAMDYQLKLLERDGETEMIMGRDIGFYYNDMISFSCVYRVQKAFRWIGSLFKEQKYCVEDLYVYDKTRLQDKINELNCLNKRMLEPRNVKFTYSNGSYQLVREVYGNKIIKDKLSVAIRNSILRGSRQLDLNEKECYENPKYTLQSEKTYATKGILDGYVKARITYQFGSRNEVLNGDLISRWLIVDKNLDVSINEQAVMNYIKGLHNKYDTVGTTRSFKTSMGKTVEVHGGLYGWKIDQEAEAKALKEHIEKGEIVEREPIYLQRALSREEDEIGDTYVEVNITRQHLWFYKEGKLIAQGSVVTGNPNAGYPTATGTYMLNYKQKDVTLTGPGYEAGVTYWMPFFGNIGIHDASWRYSFGGEIYKTRGSHGCVNAPKYLAKVIFENIEAGTPVICYEEPIK